MKRHVWAAVLDVLLRRKSSNPLLFVADDEASVDALVLWLERRRRFLRPHLFGQLMRQKVLVPIAPDMPPDLFVPYVSAFPNFFSVF